MPKYIIPPKFKYTDQQRDLAMQLFETQPNLTAADIAKQVGMSYGATLKEISKYLKSKFSAKHPAA